MKLKKILAVLLSVILICGAVPLGTITASAATSGTTGDCTWTLDGTVLTIAGNGMMGNHTSSPWNTSITEVVIEDGVKNIGYMAFRNCRTLSTVTISESVTSIGYQAFDGCKSLTSITIPESVTSIGWGAFCNCTSLTSIILPDSVTYIGSSAFDYTAYYNNAKNWENNVLYIGNHCIRAKYTISGGYKIKEGTKTIAGESFKGCTSLTSIIIPNSVISIGLGAFYDCIFLTSITIPESVTSIGYQAFYNCSSLASITISDSVTSIGSEAFYNTAYYNNTNNWENDVLYIGKHCINANTSISGDYTIKEGTKTIGDDAFANCYSLTSIAIPDGVISIGSAAFYNSISLTSVIIPYGVISIGDSAFESCVSLATVTIPNSITSINDETFEDCRALTSITIPSGITSVGDRAFSGCNSLTDVYYCGTKEQWNKIIIGNYNEELATADIHFWKSGDTNGDGVINGTDLVGFRKELFSLSTIDNNNPGVFDITDDGVFNIMDLVKIKKLLLGINQS